MKRNTIENVTNYSTIHASLSTCRPWTLIRDVPKIAESTVKIIDAQRRRRKRRTLLRAQREDVLGDAIKIGRVTMCFFIQPRGHLFHADPGSSGRCSTLKTKDGNYPVTNN